MVCNKDRSRSYVFSFSFFTLFLLHSFSLLYLLTLLSGLLIGSIIKKLFISYFVSRCFFCGLYAGFSFSSLSCILFCYSMYVRFFIFFPFPSMLLICFDLPVSSRIPRCFLCPFSGWDRNRNPAGEIAILFPLVFRFGSSFYISSRGRRY